MIHLLVETHVKLPDSGFLSDWSRNNAYESMCSDWPFNNRAVNGSKCRRDSLTISMRPPSPRNNRRNKSAEVKCVALINSRRSRRIVTISFSPEYGVRFDERFLAPGAEKYSNSEVCIPFYRIVSRNLHLTAFSWY